MNLKKILQSIENISDKYIEEAAPHPDASNNRKAYSQKRRFLHAAPVAACIALFIFSTTVFAADYIQNNISSFYLRYLGPEEMAVADAMAEQYGAKVYFDGLKTDDIYKQYFSINKLVEYYNDEEVRLKAISAITPFLDNSEEKLSTAAAFALSVLRKEYDDPHIIHLANGSVIFTLFNDYSDYGSYNLIWMIQDDIMTRAVEYTDPKLYVKHIIPSPDKNRFAVITGSAKSEYIIIYDLENGMISPELIDSARFMVAKDNDYMVWQRSDFENYSGLMFFDIVDSNGIWVEKDDISFNWLDNDTVEFKAGLLYGGGDIEEFAVVQYNFIQKHMEYSLITR